MKKPNILWARKTPVNDAPIRLVATPETIANRPRNGRFWWVATEKTLKAKNVFISSAMG
jgi:hypothetical protein